MFLSEPTRLKIILTALFIGLQQSQTVRSSCEKYLSGSVKEQFHKVWKLLKHLHTI